MEKTKLELRTALIFQEGYNRAIMQILNYCINKKNFPASDGRQIRDFCFIDDVIRAIILVIKSKENASGEIFNVGSGKNYTINEIADMFGGEKQYGNKVIEPKETLADTTKIELDLGWVVKKNISDWISDYINY